LERKKEVIICCKWRVWSGLALKFPFDAADTFFSDRKSDTRKERKKKREKRKRKRKL
jgi:hypothetical protein